MKNPRFQVRDTEDELKKLDQAIENLGYKDRADWYRDMKRKAIELSNKSFMLKIDIPNDNEEIKKQIKALEYQLSLDTFEKDREIHISALQDLKKILNK